MSYNLRYITNEALHSSQVIYRYSHVFRVSKNIIFTEIGKEKYAKEGRKDKEEKERRNLFLEHPLTRVAGSFFYMAPEGAPNFRSCMFPAVIDYSILDRYIEIE